MQADSLNLCLEAFFDFMKVQIIGKVGAYSTIALPYVWEVKFPA